MGQVLRIVPTAALLAVVLAGCGGGAPPQRSAFRGVPSALAQDWERQASAIAAAASAGNSCLASQLAVALRTDVTRSQQKLPPRLRLPLLTGVIALADRTTCPPPVTSVPRKPPKPPPEKHGHHKHDHGPGDGDGGGPDK
jgi:hypothetical protein